MIDFGHRRSLATIVTKQLEIWPDHGRYLDRSFKDRPIDVLDMSEEISGVILALATHMGGLEELCTDYRYLCEELVLPEELYFRRHGRYRLSSFADAYRECYSNQAIMGRYMNGLLLSNVFWVNHAQVFTYFSRKYLASLPRGAKHLEIGPGHGLFLYFTAKLQDIGTVVGWDISETSIENTRLAMAAMAVPRPVTLELRDLFSPDTEQSAHFDSVVLSEILEHLEDPIAALRLVRDRLTPGAVVFINVPANSPAPDHIFLVRNLEHACELATTAGLEVVESVAFPMTGTTLERARKQELAISCVVIARRPLLDAMPKDMVDVTRFRGLL